MKSDKYVTHASHFSLALVLVAALAVQVAIRERESHGHLKLVQYSFSRWAFHKYVGSRNRLLNRLEETSLTNMNWGYVDDGRLFLWGDIWPGTGMVTLRAKDSNELRFRVIKSLSPSDPTVDVHPFVMRIEFRSECPFDFDSSAAKSFDSLLGTKMRFEQRFWEADLYDAGDERSEELMKIENTLNDMITWEGLELYHRNLQRIYDRFRSESQVSAIWPTSLERISNQPLLNYGLLKDLADSINMELHFDTLTALRRQYRNYLRYRVAWSIASRWPELEASFWASVFSKRIRMLAAEIGADTGNDTNVVAHYAVLARRYTTQPIPIPFVQLTMEPLYAEIILCVIALTLTIAARSCLSVIASDPLHGVEEPWLMADRQNSLSARCLAWIWNVMAASALPICMAAVTLVVYMQAVTSELPLKEYGIVITISSLIFAGLCFTIMSIDTMLSVSILRTMRAASARESATQ